MSSGGTANPRASEKEVMETGGLQDPAGLDHFWLKNIDVVCHSL